MYTIAEENLKPVRRRLDVFCGIDESLEVPESISITHCKSDFHNIKWTQIGLRTPVMDLAGGGFKADGNAIPVPASEIEGLNIGMISEAVTNEGGYFKTGEAPNITIKIPRSSDYYYVTIHTHCSSGKYVRYYKDALNSRDRRTIDFTFNRLAEGNSRLIIDRIVIGYSWTFGNDSLENVNLTLRGVETKIDKPSLQTSEINITAYSKEDISHPLSMISENSPIWYTAGYPGDMSPIRMFYMSQAATFSDNKISIRGEDATRFINDSFSGKFYRCPMWQTMYYYWNAIVDIIKSTGVDVNIIGSFEKEDDRDPSAFSEWYGYNGSFLLPEMSKRDIIAQAVNCIRLSTNYKDYRIDYVDAGIPTLTANRDLGDIYEIPSHGKITREIDYQPSLVGMYNPDTNEMSDGVGPSYTREFAQIEEITDEASVGTMAIKTTSDPYSAFSATGGTVEFITPYKYKITVNSVPCVVSGCKINMPFKDGTTGTEGYIYSGYDFIVGGSTVILPEMNGNMVLGYVDGNEPVQLLCVAEYATEQALERDYRLYSFEWRGDPKLQPRDYIDVDGTEMTIDTITLEHKGGGLTSKITAKWGTI